MLSHSAFLTADTETTGLYNKDKHGAHRVVELGLVASREGVIESANHYLMNPERPIHAAATRIHGIDDNQVKNRPIFSALLDHMISIMQLYPNATIWFHNAPFDTRMIKQELQFCDPNKAKLFNDRQSSCSLSLARLLKPKNNTLDDLLQKYGIEASMREQGHGALIDSVLLARLLPKLSEDVLSTAQKATVLDDMLTYCSETQHDKPTL